MIMPTCGRNHAVPIAIAISARARPVRGHRPVPSTTAPATLLIGGSTAMADPQRAYVRRVDEGRRESGWRTLGTRTADGAERRYIQVGGQRAGAFRVIRLEAGRRVPRVTCVEIEFGNGE